MSAEKLMFCQESDLFAIVLLHYIRYELAFWRELFRGESMIDDIPIPLCIRQPKFLDEVRLAIRRKNLAYTTEKTYLYWIRLFIRFQRRRHPRDMGTAEVDEFLSWLAVEKHIAPTTQAMALNALVFLYHKFLGIDLGKLNFTRPAAKR
jgi:hypothetical protein